MRVDTNTSRIDLTGGIYTSYYPNVVNIVVMSYSEILYGYNSGSSRYNLVKLNYIQSGESNSSLSQVYHQRMSGNSQYRAVSKITEDNQTFWHAVNMNDRISYFQINWTDSSLIGSRYTCSENVTRDGLEMD